MFFQDDSSADFELLCDALKALADLKNPGAKWMKKHIKIYLHAMEVKREDSNMRAKGWSGSNGVYQKLER